MDIILVEKDKINNIHFRKTSIEIFCSKSSSIQVELDENAFYTVFYFWNVSYDGRTTQSYTWRHWKENLVLEQSFQVCLEILCIA